MMCLGTLVRGQKAMNTDQHTIKTRRYTMKHAPSVIVALLLAPLIAFAEEKAAPPSNGLVPEVPGLNLKDKLYQLEAKLPDLEQPYIIGYRGKLIFESYYRRGRANFPHYQMSITKSYTALAIGRAIQLGLLKMEDLDKPAISFLKELDTTKLVAGADTITLAQAMQVLNAVAPGGAEEFIKTELLGRMGIAQYRWEHAISGSALADKELYAWLLKQSRRENQATKE